MGDISPPEGDISSLGCGIRPLEYSISPLEGGISPLEDGIRSLEDGISSLEGSIGSLEGDTSSLEGSISPLEGGIRLPEEVLGLGAWYPVISGVKPIKLFIIVSENKQKILDTIRDQAETETQEQIVDRLLHQIEEVDEVFDSSLDDSSTQELMKILRNLGSSTNVFVISHKGDILAVKFMTTLRFEKINDFSKMKDVS